MKRKISPRVLLPIVALLLNGCRTWPLSNPNIPKRVYIGGRHESYVGTREQIGRKIKKYGLDNWNVGTNLYAEGRTYGMHFSEYSTSRDLLDGCATDGCTKSREAQKNK